MNSQAAGNVEREEIGINVVCQSDDPFLKSLLCGGGILGVRELGWHSISSLGLLSRVLAPLTSGTARVAKYQAVSRSEARSALGKSVGG